jgi:hypothetical protein
VKTEITSAEATLRKLDEKGRLAGAIARDRFGWASAAVSRLLVIEDTSTARRRVGAHLELFDAALPITSGDLRCWLAQPTVAIAGRLFLSPSNGRAGIQAGGGRHRVRRARNDGDRPGLSVRPDGVWQARALDDPRRTLLIG